MANVTKFSQITELPGNDLTREQLEMIECRYVTAAKYVKGKSVLEVGCGPGLGLGYLKEQGASRVVGSDVNPNSIEIAKTSYLNEDIELNVFSADSIPYDDSVFDTVLLFEVMFYFEDVDKCLSEISRVLKDGGKLVLCIPNKDVPSFIPSQFSYKYYSPEELKVLLKKYFGDVQIYGAFKIRNNVVKTARSLRIQLAKVLNLFPKSQEFKNVLKKYLMGQSLKLRNRLNPVEISYEMIKIQGQNSDYKLLYSICSK